MIAPDATPIRNISPLPRIGMNEPQPANPNIEMLPTKSIAEMIEQDRIWSLIEQASEGNG
jgi:hypothetical protein